MKKKSKIKIFVAHHKPGYIYEDDVYVPIQVGKKNAKIDLGILGDDTGDNISEKNDNYAELTAQYWVWKNYDLRDVDYVGFCHYRRYMTYCYRPNLWKYLSMKKSRQELIRLWKEGNSLFEYDKDILLNNSRNITNYLSRRDYDLYTAKREVFWARRLRKYLGMRVNDFNGFLDFSTLRWFGFNGQRKDKPREIFLDLYPHYRGIIKEVEEKSKEYVPLHRHMFIMRRDLFLDYADWLFKYLFELEKYITKHHLQTTGIYGKGETRFIGIFSEPLINYWILYSERAKGIKVQSKSNLLFFTN